MKTAMKPVTCVFRHGENDFSVWNVDLPVSDIERLKHRAVLKSSDLASLLQQMPITDTMPYDAVCIFSTDKGYTLSIYEVDEQFVETYNHHGGSVRGNITDIIDELTPPMTEGVVTRNSMSVPTL